MPEDLQVLELARAMSWRRCPACKAFVELTHGTRSNASLSCCGSDGSIFSGCNHMTCLCRFEFCHRCAIPHEHASATVDEYLEDADLIGTAAVHENLRVTYGRMKCC